MVLGIYAPRGIPVQAATFVRNACPKVVDSPLVRSAAEKTASPLAYADGPAYAASLLHDARVVGELIRHLGIKAQ